MMVRYGFRVCLWSPLAIGTGLVAIGVDDTVPRWHDGCPFLPATMLKGAARDALRLSDAPGSLLDCLGTPGDAAGGAMITDALPSEERPLPLVSAVTTVSLDEHRTPRPGALAATEIVEPLVHDAGTWRRASFDGSVLLAPTVPEDVARRAAGALLIGMAAVRSLGRRTSRGWGQVRIALAPDSAELARSVLAFDPIQEGAR